MAQDPREAKEEKEKLEKARKDIKEKLIDDGPVNKLFKKAADKLREKNKKKAGGMLKAPTNTGLKKLPTEVRNKMGFMNKGGKVKAKKMNKCRMDGIAIRGKTRAKQRSK